MPSHQFVVCLILHFHIKVAHIKEILVDLDKFDAVSSPTPATKPKAQTRVVTSGYFSHEQSEDEEFDTESGPCEQSNDPLQLKRFRRY